MVRAAMSLISTLTVEVSEWYVDLALRLPAAFGEYLDANIVI